MATPSAQWGSRRIYPFDEQAVIRPQCRQAIAALGINLLLASGLTNSGAARSFRKRLDALMP